MNASNSHAHQNNQWDFLNEFDNVVTNLFRPLQGDMQTPNKAARVPTIDIAETSTSYIITAELPGVSKENIDVSIEDDVLTLDASVKDATEEKTETQTELRYIRKERRKAGFHRTIRLSDNVDHNNVQAIYEDGILQLTLPKAAKAQARKINVQSV